MAPNSARTSPGQQQNRKRIKGDSIVVNNQEYDQTRANDVSIAVPTVVNRNVSALSETTSTTPQLIHDIGNERAATSTLPLALSFHTIDLTHADAAARYSIPLLSSSEIQYLCKKMKMGPLELQQLRETCSAAHEAEQHNKPDADYLSHSKGEYVDFSRTLQMDEVVQAYFV